MKMYDNTSILKFCNLIEAYGLARLQRYSQRYNMHYLVIVAVHAMGSYGYG